MAQMIPRLYSNDQTLRHEIIHLKNELAEVKKEMESFKEFMKTNASFTDFKRFKMVEEEKETRENLRRRLVVNDPFELLPF